MPNFSWLTTAGPDHRGDSASGGGTLHPSLELTQIHALYLDNPTHGNALDRGNGLGRLVSLPP